MLLNRFKYALAKTWYLIPFYFLSYFTLDVNRENTFRQIFLFLWLGLCIAISYVMLRHFATGFSFKDINEAVRPIFRNHVNYASMLVVFLPYLLYLRSSSKHKWLYSFALLFLIIAIYFSYTRAAQLSIVIAALCYYVDISTMERVHRWVAGFTMVSEKPIVGFGPGCFYPFYKNHTVSSFKTYVSDNPEKSGIHNNFLMVFVEQGIIGFLIMILLCFVPILIGERAYHLLRVPWQKNIVMAATVSVIVTVAVLLINDLLEADKVGPLFFLSLSIIAILHAHGKQNAESSNI